MKNCVKTTMLLLVLTLAVIFAAQPVIGKADKHKKSDKAELDGAIVYGNACSRCHRAPEPSQRSAADWQTIMLHMRVRANLTRNETNAVLKFLKEQVKPLKVRSQTNPPATTSTN